MFMPVVYVRPVRVRVLAGLMPVPVFMVPARDGMRVVMVRVVMAVEMNVLVLGVSVAVSMLLDRHQRDRHK